MKCKASLAFFQETKSRKMDDYIAKEVWDGMHFNQACFNAFGSVEGILMKWDTCHIVVKD